MESTGTEMCFACGRDNPISLSLDFELIEENTVQTNFTPEPEHQGYNDIMHGGLISTLLDEAMAKVLELNEIPALTAEMTTRFKKSVEIGSRLTITGKLNDHYKSLYYTEGRLENEAGEVLATAEAKFLESK